MKFTIVYTIALVILSVNGVLSKSNKSKKARGFCAGKTLSDGTQISKGSCSTAIQGDIPSSDNMPSTLIVSPENGAELDANKEFSVDILIHNIETGKFSDPEKEYNIIPQELNDDGLILGHTHVTIQKLNGHNPPDARKFAFFKGVEDKADSKGRLSVSVVDEDGKKGLPEGSYRICTMAGSFSHQAVVMPIAKRGAQDDCIRIKVESKEDKGKHPK